MLTENRYHLILGLVLVSIFSTVLWTIGSWMHIHAQINQLHRVSETYQTKSSLMLKMWDTVRARESVFQKMLITKDAFELDDLQLEHMSLAERFILTRQELTAMEITATEQVYLESLDSATSIGSPIQSKIRNLILDGDHPAAREHASSEDYINARKSIIYNLESMFQFYQKQTAQAIDNSRTSVLGDVKSSLSLVCIVLMIAVSIGVMMLRKIVRYDRALVNEINEHLDTQAKLEAQQAQLQEQIDEAIEQYKQTEADSHRNQKLAASLEDILEFSINEIYIFDSDNLKFIQANEVARKNLGYTNQELMTMTPVDILSGLDTEVLKAILDPASIDEFESQKFDTTHRRKDGSTYPAEAHLQRSVLDEQSVFILIVQDLSDIEEQEHQLQANQTEMDELSNEYAFLNIAINEHAIVCVMDKNERIENINDSYAASTGYSSEELIGNYFCTTISLDQPGADLHTISSTINQGDIWNGELKLRTKEDDEFWTMTTITPFYNKNAEIYRFVSVSTDITETKRIQKEMADFNLKLDETQRELEFQVKALDQHAIVTVTDVDGTFTYANNKFCKISQYSQDEIIGQNHDILCSRAHDKEFYRNLWSTITQGKVWNNEVCHCKKDGSLYWVKASIVPFLDDKGKPYKFVAIQLDITEQKLVHEQLLNRNIEIEKAHKELADSHHKMLQTEKLASVGQLAAGIAHEINTPTQFVGDNTRFLKESFEDMFELLYAYKSLTEAIEEGKPSDLLLKAANDLSEEVEVDYLKEEIPTAIDQSLDGISRITKIVRSMKDFSHPGTDYIENIDINKAIESTINVSRNEWKYIAELETIFDDSLVSLPCFAGEMNQVILNIIVNGAHAIAENRAETDPLGKITVQTEALENVARITIRDSGCGMPEEIRKRIFEPFYTTKGVGKGTGQGLAIAYSVVVDKHHGKLEVESEPGVGTVFTITLPLDVDSDSPGNGVIQDQLEEIHIKSGAA